MTDFKFQWPYTRVGDIWLFRKFDTSVLVCEGMPQQTHKGYVTFPNMLEVSIYEEYDEETDTVRMKQQRSEETPYHFQIRTFMGDNLARWTSAPVLRRYISQEGLELAQQILEKHINEYVPAMILKGKSTVYGQEMIAQSNFYQYPESYRCDLYHRDFYRIGVEEPTRFAWILYRAGTNLLLHSNNVDMFIKHRMSQWDNPKYYWADMGILAQRDPMDVHTQALTHLPSREEI